MPDPEGSAATLPECCTRYLRNSADLMIEWWDCAEDARQHPDRMIRPEAYAEAHRGQADLIKRIAAGEPCPWHDGIPEDYLAVMKAMGGSDGR